MHRKTSSAITRRGILDDSSEVQEGKFISIGGGEFVYLLREQIHRRNFESAIKNKMFTSFEGIRG